MNAADGLRSGGAESAARKRGWDMRLNEPITNHEVEMTDGQLLVSQTDAGGKIMFVNQAFIEISGFSEAELVGSPHNIVRHPHMPKEAFRDLWRVIQSGCGGWSAKRGSSHLSITRTSAPSTDWKEPQQRRR